MTRNVKLEWLKDANAALYDDDANSSTIGLIINSVQPFSIKNAITGTFRTSRHWWAITRLRRVTKIENDQGAEFDFNSSTFINAQSGERVEYHRDEWMIVNSQDISASPRSIRSKEINMFVSKVIAEQGNVFRATLSLR